MPRTGNPARRAALLWMVFVWLPVSAEPTFEERVGDTDGPLSLSVGFVVGSIDDLDPRFTLKKVVTVFAFASALVFLGLFGLAYVLRQHHLWREHRGGDDTR